MEIVRIRGHVVDIRSINVCGLVDVLYSTNNHVRWIPPYLLQCTRYTIGVSVALVVPLLFVVSVLGTVSFRSNANVFCLESL